MFTPRPSPSTQSFRRHLVALAFALLVIATLSGCGNGPARSSATERTGPGGVTIGQSRATVEKTNDGWTIHSTSVDGAHTVVTYRDYHWSLARGFTHSAEYHHITYTANGDVVAWVSNSNPESIKP